MVTLMKVVTEVGAPWYTSGVQVWKGAALILKARPTNSSATPGHEQRVDGGAGALQRRRDLGELGVAGLAVDQRHAEEQEARGEAAEQQVLQRRLLRARLVAAEAAEDVQRDREQLDRQEDDHQAARAGEEHHPGGGGEDQRVVLAVVQAAAVEVLRADHQHQRGAHQDDRVDEQPEAVVGEGAEVHRVRRGRVEPAPHRGAERRGHRDQAEAREPAAMRGAGDQVEQQQRDEARRRGSPRGGCRGCRRRWGWSAAAARRRQSWRAAHRRGHRGGAERAVGDGDGLLRRWARATSPTGRGNTPRSTISAVSGSRTSPWLTPQVANALGARLRRVVHQPLVQTQHVPAGEHHAHTGEHRVGGVAAGRRRA